VCDKNDINRDNSDKLSICWKPLDGNSSVNYFADFAAVNTGISRQRLSTVGDF